MKTVVFAKKHVMSPKAQSVAQLDQAELPPTSLLSIHIAKTHSQHIVLAIFIHLVYIISNPYSFSQPGPTRPGACQGPTRPHSTRGPPEAHQGPIRGSLGDLEPTRGKPEAHPTRGPHGAHPIRSPPVTHICIYIYIYI